MIFVTGDCHADWRKFSQEDFPEQKSMTRDDFVIVCGDFGLWHDNEYEQWWMKWLARKRFTLLFVDGNHENFDRLYHEFEIVDFHGGKAHKIRENVYHLMRGYVFTLCGKKFFAFGGARSHDIEDGILDVNNYIDAKALNKDYNRRRGYGEMIRINHVSWWKEEMPSDEEMTFGLKTLRENGNEVDFVISHCCPQTVVAEFGMYGLYKADKLTKYFNDVANATKFTKWYFGHYHDEMQINGKYVMLYRSITRIL